MYPFQLTPFSLSTLYLFLSYSVSVLILFPPFFVFRLGSFYLSEELFFYFIEILS